jgi:hypothetical protein
MRKSSAAVTLGWGLNADDGMSTVHYPPERTSFLAPKLIDCLDTGSGGV